MCSVLKKKPSKPEPIHSVSFRAFGLSIDGRGLGGVIVVPVILLVVVLAGSSLAGGMVWLSRLFPSASAISEAPPAEAVDPRKP